MSISLDFKDSETVSYVVTTMGVATPAVSGTYTYEYPTVAVTIQGETEEYTVSDDTKTMTDPVGTVYTRK